MKKLLLSLLALIAVVSASAGSYTITFKGAGSTSTAYKPNMDLSTIIGGENKYVKAVPSVTYVYPNGDNGIKFGSSKYQGTIKLELNENVVITSVTVNAAKYGYSKDLANENLSVYLTENGTPVSFGLKDATFQDYAVAFDGGVETSTIYLQSTKRAYLKSITVEYKDANPDADPETPVVTVNGESYGNDAEIEVVKGDVVSVVSANATEMLVNGEAVAVSNGKYEFSAEVSDVYTFQGKNGEKLSEEIAVMLDVDDLGWQTVVGGMQAYVFDMTNPEGLTPSITAPAEGKGANLGNTVLTAGSVSVSATNGSTDTRFWNTRNVGIDLRIYAGTQNNPAKGVMTVTGPEMTKIVFKMTDSSNYGFTPSEGSISFDATELTYTWTANTPCDKVTFTATKQNRIKSMEVISGGSETVVKAPEFYVGDVLLDAGGNSANGIKVEAGAVIKVVGHKRTHVHYYVEGEEAAANVKALMSVNEADVPWIANDGKEKHVFEYTVPEKQTQDITIYAKAAKEGYKSLMTQMVLSADRIATGIEAVDAESAEGEAEFFNLQGQRVLNPSAGLYIKKVGQKVEKVIL